VVTEEFEPRTSAQERRNTVNELTAGMTWQEIRDRLEEADLVVEFRERGRRTSKSMRQLGHKDPRKYWRLTILRPQGGSTVRVFRKKLLFFKDEEEKTPYLPENEKELLAERAPVALVERINRSFG
jgi:hypothetical protein